jgi:ribosome-associated toxin RatA of RatAB toxin-antitoxin module
MRKIKIDEIIKIPIEKVWEPFEDLDKYPKYFKYVNKIFHKEKQKLGTVWYDFATYVVPIIVKHETTVFEKEKAIGFDINTFYGVCVKERLTLEKNGQSTKITGFVEYDLGNPIFRRLFDNLFEKRMKESIQGAIKKITIENS